MKTEKLNIFIHKLGQSLKCHKYPYKISNSLGINIVSTLMRHSANHNLLSDKHLRVPVWRVKTCTVMTVGLFKMSGRVTGKLSSETWKLDTRL